MAKQRNKESFKRTMRNQRRTRISFVEVLSSANRRAHEQANRRSGRRELKSVRAAIAATDMGDCEESTAWSKRLLRWVLALALLPLCWVTSWTFLSRFSRAAVEQGFWQTAAFWYFSTGILVMVGWFWSGLWKSFFLYAYVLGHELTHAVFVVLFRGKVMDFHVSHEGGYITTNKTNLVIALSPYFVPFWSVICALVYAVLRISVDLKPGWDLAFYAVMGGTWTFHMAWTLWMIPRDQPDLKENGTFLSLVVIYLANLLVLVVLFCVAEEFPLRNSREFALEWLRHAATWSDSIWRWALQMIDELKTAAKF
ncbi:MAG: hypothetical protein H8M99_14360 [Gloeobacteraceae cyanobacterium ES-bin-144]|nr:hypothetical protein [Verrucomicrobiales bacterium]